MMHEFKPLASYFLGSRLKEVREGKGLTLTQLSALTGISKQSLSCYEKDVQKPRSEPLSKLMSALGVNLAFFQKETAPRSQSPIFFRSLASMKRVDRNRARVQLGWFEELFAFLSEYIEFTAPNLPENFDISNRLLKTEMEEIDRISAKVRQYWGLGNGPISNLTRLLENNGIVILKMDLDVRQEDAFSQWQMDHRLPVIVNVADSLASCRQRFTLAHELGHLILHSKIGRLDNETLPTIEKQAHRFASSFLLPADSWATEFYSADLESFRILKSRWKVSIAAQILRAKDLGLISEQICTNLYIYMAKRKWKTTEPLDDTIAIESPRMLAEAMNLLETQVGMDIPEICSAVSLPEADIRMLLERQDIETDTINQKATPARIIQFTSKTD